MHTRRSACAGCGRVMAIKAKSLCQSCWRRSPKLPSGRRPRVRPAPDWTPVRLDYLLGLYDRAGRFGSAVARRRGAGWHACEDAYGVGVVAAVLAAAALESERVLFQRVRSAVFNAIRDRLIRIPAAPSRHRVGAKYAKPDPLPWTDAVGDDVPFGECEGIGRIVA